MTSRIDSKRAFLAALTAVAVAFALVLAAGGSPASAEDVDSWPISSETNHESFWEEWGAETHTPGEDDWACTKDDRGGQGAFVLEQEPEEGAFWRLLVLKAGSDRVDLHWNPLSGASFEHSVMGGWSHVILCSRPITNPTTTTTLPEVTTTLPEVTTTTTIPDEVSPTSIVSTTTTIVSATTTIVSATTSIVSTTVEVSDETLPFTGFENGTSGLLALMLVASGALALVGTRVFRKETDE